MTPYRFRGHASGLDLEATLDRFPQLGSGDEAAQRLARALDAAGKGRSDGLRTELRQLVARWEHLATEARRSRFGRASAELVAMPDKLADLLALVPDASAIITHALPRGLLARAVARDAAARISAQGLADLARVLERRLDQAVARELSTDQALSRVVDALCDSGSGGDKAGSTRGGTST